MAAQDRAERFAEIARKGRQEMGRSYTADEVHALVKAVARSDERPSPGG